MTVAPLIVACGPALAHEDAKAKSDPLLLANYYVWYRAETDEQSLLAGWTHPDQKDSVSDAGSPGPPIASVLYPLAGLYDSRDAQVAEWHVELAQAAGIDGFLVSWWGDYTQPNPAWENGILAAAERKGFKVALLDERAQYHDDFEWYKANLAGTLRRFKDHPAYLRIDNKPVVYLYQVAANPSLTPEKFSELKAHVEKEHGPIFWIVDKLAHNHQDAGDSIKHIPNEWLDTPGIDCFALYSTFSHLREHTYEDLAGKYRYLTNLAHDARKKMLVPVHPGHDNSRFSDNPYVIPRDDGRTFKGYLRAAEESGADIIMVTSWNEWPESTVIEPSTTWPNPYRYLEILAESKAIEFVAPATVGEGQR